jgi:hypothetical protein
MANNLKGKEVRRVVSVRMEPSKKDKLIKRYGSIQAAIDWLIAMVDKKDKG